MNTDLKASIKTRFGPTRDVDMEIGGKQGSRLTGRMFAKMMDLLSEYLSDTELGFSIDTDFIISVLLWVDDVISCVESEEEQEEMLMKVNEFAIKHKIKWGQSKCNVMRVGKHRKSEREWKLGDMVIQETKKYKYLGDIVTPNGKNAENLQDRCTKLQATTINVNAIASSEILHRIETAVILEFYDKKCIPGLLNNAEAWNLSKKEEKDIEKMEIQAIKYLFDLPLHMPTVAIMYSFGLLYTTQRIDQMQLIYLHRLLQRGDDNWPKKTLYTLKDKGIGWFTRITNTLHRYNLPTDFQTIASIRPNSWKNAVKLVIEQKNKERLKDDLYKYENGTEILKTKTKSILEKLSNPLYSRKPDEEIVYTTKYETKTILIARYGMLECGPNFEGTHNPICQTCDVLDDESHRLNYCPKWNDPDDIETRDLIDFDAIYSSDIETIRPIIREINRLWNTKCANGSMIK